MPEIHGGINLQCYRCSEWYIFTVSVPTVVTKGSSVEYSSTTHVLCLCITDNI